MSQLHTTSNDMTKQETLCVASLTVNMNAQAQHVMAQTVAGSVAGSCTALADSANALALASQRWGRSSPERNATRTTEGVQYLISVS